VSDPTINEAILQVNNQEYLVPVQHQRFDKIVALTAGVNRILARVVYQSDRVSQSIPVEYQYIFDRAPVVKITTNHAGRTVTLDGSQTFSPVGANLTYSWRADETNPQAVTLSSRTSAVTTLELPTTPGEYYFTLTVRAGIDAGWGRTVLVVDDSSQFQPVDLSTWHPAWVDRMTLYEIFVRTYSVTGKLSAVLGRMSLLKDLGVNCLWFMPLHPSPSTHGYWITDYYDIHPDYGTLEDFRKVVNEAHKYGIKVVMDLVINHTVDTHPFMLDALENGAYSPYRDFYSWNVDGTFQYLYTWVNLPSINFSTPWVQDYLINMCKWWVQKYNVDGFRCDVAHAIEERRSEGPAFWQRWRRELKAIKPDLFLLAEAAASDPRYFDKKFDSAYDYWLYGELRNALSATSGADNLNRVVTHYLNQVPENARPMRYLENHDESRFLSSYSVAQTKVAAALMFTLPGIPLIYAGQEVGDLSARGLVNWNDPNQLKPFYKKLIGIRNANSSLMTGAYGFVPAKNQNVYAFLRHDATQTFLIVANLANTAQTGVISMALADLPGDTTTTFYLNDALTDISTPVTGADLLHWSVNLTPNQISIYEFSKTPTGVNRQSAAPNYFGLDWNYPNPFNATTQLRYHIGGVQRIEIRLDIYNVLGQRIRTLVRQPVLPGHYQVHWDGQNDHGEKVSSGVYLCQLHAENFTQVIKMVILK
ncbi:alpha-glucosidase C-terminal domain-containing protein, partial [candidate division KSB1 bacterium]|nr:alpha-glucosidase C-terminal domain-containing protein [candidate division KSB1 bacterium]